MFNLRSMCHLCHLSCETSLPICEQCIAILPWNTSYCIKCAAFLPPELSRKTCGHCLSHPWHFDYCYAAFSYEKYIRKMVAQLKFHNQLINAHILGTLLARQIPHWYQDNPLPEVLLPVPLHSSRTRKRGFNQALEIAKVIKKITKMPFDYHFCKRIKKTKPQTTLHKNQRKSNLINAFAVASLKQYQHVAILDDVFTTGDTVNTLAATLKRSGIQQVDVWCVARARLR